jgi:hypothetical protein
LSLNTEDDFCCPKYRGFIKQVIGGDGDAFYPGYNFKI